MVSRIQQGVANYMAVSPDLVDQFDTTDDSTVTGSPVTAELSSAQVLNGATSWHILGPAGGNQSMHIDPATPPLNWNGYIRWWVYVVDWTLLTNFQFRVGDTASLVNESVVYTYDIVGSTVHQYNGWHLIEIGPTAWVRLAGAADVDDIIRNIADAGIARTRITANPEGSEQAEFYVDSVWVNGRSRPQIMIVFDDGQIGQFNIARDIINAAGLKVTFAPARTAIGGANFMTLANLETLKADGHAFAVHGATDLTTLPFDDAVAEVIAAQAWTDSYDPIGRQVLIYINGNTNDALTDEWERLGIRIARHASTPSNWNGVSYFQNALAPKASAMRGIICGQVASQSVATTTSNIDDMIRNGQHGFLMYHDIVATGATVLEVNTADFQAVIDHVATRQNQGLIDVVTTTDLIKGLDVSRRAV